MSRFDSPLWPTERYRGELVDPQLPEGPFWLRYPWSDVPEGPFAGSNFITDPETRIAYSSNYPAHPVFVYCVAREGSSLVLLEPADLSTYRVELIAPGPAV